jgi:hypothetical protein
MSDIYCEINNSAFFSHVLTEHELFFSGPCCPRRTLHLMVFQCSAHFGLLHARIVINSNGCIAPC